MITVSGTINELRSRNYDHDFIIENDLLLCKKTGESFTPYELVIDDIHRFENDLIPGGLSIIYTISAISGIKGLVVDAYGTDSSSHIGSFIKDIPFKNKLKF